jgi:hypothetical protein
MQEGDSVTDPYEIIREFREEWDNSILDGDPLAVRFDELSVERKVELINDYAKALTGQDGPIVTIDRSDQSMIPLT